MKNQKSPRIHYALKATFFAALLAVSACQEKKETSEEKKTPVVKTESQTPQVDIHEAVITNNIAVVKQYIAAKSDLNVKEQFGGSSPLITACVFGKTEIAKLFIDAGADLNQQNNDGSTALIAAAFFCRTEIVKMLLAKGANKNIKNKYGSTAYESVASSFAEAKKAYDGIGPMLEPMGLKLDYGYLEKTRPVVAKMLK